jgi:hypothetical protein
MPRRLRAACAAALLAAGCAPSIANLERFLDAGEPAKAVADVAGKPDMQAELAALVLERSARDGVEVETSVRALASGAAPGRRALERLVGTGTGEGARLAFVALHRTSAPDRDDLARCLADDSSLVRAAAAEAWAAETETDGLRAMAADPEPRVRAAAVRELSRREGDVGALLREVLRLDPDARVRSEAARSGRAFGREALLALEGALNDSGLGVRMAAVRGLAGLESADASAQLADLCMGPLDEVGVAAAAELCRAGDRRGCDRLEAALADSSAILRQTALLHLDRAGIEERDVLAARLLDDPDGGVAVQAASMLAGSSEHEAAARKALKRVAASAAPEAKDALHLLATWGDADAVKEIAAVLAGTDEAAILGALAGTARCPALLASFAPLLADARVNVRLAAARAVLAAFAAS